MTAQVKVEVLGDARSVKRAFGDAGKSVDKFGGVLKTAAGVAGGVLIAGAVEKAASATVGFLGDAITSASDLAEQSSKLGVVFGKSAGAIETWSKGTARAIGLSEREAKTAAGTFGTLLAPMGKAPKATAAMSQKLTTLAADMASFNNADISDTLLAIQSGLRGESEPLRKYGVMLDDAALKAEAMAQGIDDGKGPLTAQQKQMAAMALIFKQTAKQQGDYARTSDGLANTQRTNAALMEDFASKIGTALLPAVTELMRMVSDQVIPALMEFADIIGPTLSAAMATVMPILQQLATAVMPIIAEAFRQLGPLVAALAPMISDLVSTLLPPLVKLFQDIAPVLAELGAALIPAIIEAFAILGPIISKVAAFVGEVLLPAIGELVKALGAALGPIIRQLGPLFSAWSGPIGAVVDVLITLAKIAIAVLLPVLKVVLSVVGKLIALFLAVMGVVGRVASAFVGLAGTIVNKLARALSGLVEFGRKIIDNIIKGIESMAGEIVKAILGILPGPVRDLVGGAIGLRAAPATMATRTTRARGARGGRAAPAGGVVNVTLSVQSADSEAVMRALRRWASANGGRPAFDRALTRAAS